MGEDLGALRQRLREFAAEREWDQFHTPKNLVMALSGEVGELVSVFQWLTAEESAAVMEGHAADQVREEVADVAIYLLRLADVLNLDLVELMDEKLRTNSSRYPADLARGNARKYTELGSSLADPPVSSG